MLLILQINGQESWKELFYDFIFLLLFQPAALEKMLKTESCRLTVPQIQYEVTDSSNSSDLSNINWFYILSLNINFNV